LEVQIHDYLDVQITLLVAKRSWNLIKFNFFCSASWWTFEMNVRSALDSNFSLRLKCSSCRE
jgi:hypothetical protein